VDDFDAFPATVLAHDGQRLPKGRLRRRAVCSKCPQGTMTGYRAGGRLWPTCYDCARRAARVPCDRCGDTTPWNPVWHGPDASDERGRMARHHESGAVCFEGTASGPQRE
jgi:hypothetical protein